MSISVELVREIELLNMFDLDSVQQGLKIHHEADSGFIEAATRLFEKGMTTQIDGGYLTDRGLEAAEKVQTLIRMMQAG